MKIKLIFLLLFFKTILLAFSCFSIRTETGDFTPVAPSVTAGEEIKQCTLKELPIDFLEGNNAYIGCYKYKRDAINRYNYLKKSGFKFKKEIIVDHNISKIDSYLVFPYYSKIGEYDLKRKYTFLLQKNLIKNLIDKIPTKFYGNNYSLESLSNFPLLPIRNLYPYYLHNQNGKVLVLYQGVYNLERLYHLLSNKNLLEKKGKDTYLLKIPLYVSYNATLIVNNKNLLLQAKPSPIFIMYNGSVYINNSKVVTWDSKKNQEHRREYVPDKELLMIGRQKPIPYFLGLGSSYSSFLNSSFSKLGFHDSISTFGISLLHYPTHIFRTFLLKSYLSKLNNPTGKFIGNTIYNNMMGFYTNDAQDVVLLGNLFYNNLIYDVDPHDYSSNLLIARNILIGAHHAHGVVISRGVDDSIIAQNIAFKNHSDGIMLDRDCKYNLVYDNFSFENGYMGISFQESDKNTISSNVLFRNHIDGIISRNSLNILIKNNIIKKNGRNGVEILNKNINDTVYRDFQRDPYHIATSAILQNNMIKQNLGSGVMVKNSAAILLKKNIIQDNIQNYGQDLASFTPKLFENPARFELYGLGNPFNSISIDRLKIKKSILHTVKNQFIYLSHSNDSFEMTLAQFYEALNMYTIANAQIMRAISNRVAVASYRYALEHLHIEDKNKYKLIHYISYIIESAILGNNEARQVIYYLPFIFWVSKEDIKKSFILVKERMKKGKLIDKQLSCACKPSNISKKIIQSKLNLFLFAMKFNGINSIYEYSKKKAYQVKNFTPLNMQKIRESIYNSNIPKIKYFRFLHKKSIAMAKDKRCRKHLNKMEFIREESSYILNNNDKEDLLFIKKNLKKYLKMVNKYRVKKIKIPYLLKFLKE